MNNRSGLEYKKAFSIQGIQVVVFPLKRSCGVELRMSINFPDFDATIPVYAGATQTHTAADAIKLINALPESFLESRVSHARKEFREPLRNTAQAPYDYCDALSLGIPTSNKTRYKNKHFQISLLTKKEADIQCIYSLN